MVSNRKVMNTKFVTIIKFYIWSNGQLFTYSFIQFSQFLNFTKLLFLYLTNEFEFGYDILQGCVSSYHLHVWFFGEFRQLFCHGLHRFSRRLWFALDMFPTIQHDFILSRHNSEPFVMYDPWLWSCHNHGVSSLFNRMLGSLLTMKGEIRWSLP